jgi:hypothetical protein
MRKLGRKLAIGVEAFASREQGLVGLIFANTGPKLGAFGDIGRVA